MAVDLSEYKEAIANAYEGRAVRDAIVAMVQAVEDAINTGGSSELDTRVEELESHEAVIQERLTNVIEKATYIERALFEPYGGIAEHVDNLEDRVTALEGGSTNENDT